MAVGKIIDTRISHKIDTEENWNKAVNFIPKKNNRSHNCAKLDYNQKQGPYLRLYFHWQKLFQNYKMSRTAYGQPFGYTLNYSVYN